MALPISVVEFSLGRTAMFSPCSSKAALPSSTAAPLSAVAVAAKALRMNTEWLVASLTSEFPELHRAGPERGKKLDANSVLAHGARAE